MVEESVLLDPNLVDRKDSHEEETDDEGRDLRESDQAVMRMRWSGGRTTGALFQAYVAPPGGDSGFSYGKMNVGEGIYPR